MEPQTCVLSQHERAQRPERLPRQPRLGRGFERNRGGPDDAPNHFVAAASRTLRAETPRQLSACTSAATASRCMCTDTWPTPGRAAPLVSTSVLRGRSDFLASRVMDADSNVGAAGQTTHRIILSPPPHSARASTTLYRRQRNRIGLHVQEPRMTKPMSETSSCNG